MRITDKRIDWWEKRGGGGIAGKMSSCGGRKEKREMNKDERSHVVRPKGLLKAAKGLIKMWINFWFNREMM